MSQIGHQARGRPVLCGSQLLRNALQVRRGDRRGQGSAVALALRSPTSPARACRECVPMLQTLGRRRRQGAPAAAPSWWSAA
eukprot:8104150-Alexandrium_andersonii.AAC.1